MAGLLETAKVHLAHKMTHMQGIRGWVKADVNSNGALRKSGREGNAIGGVVNESTSVEVGEQVHSNDHVAT